VIAWSGGMIDVHVHAQDKRKGGAGQDECHCPAEKGSSADFVAGPSRGKQLLRPARRFASPPCSAGTGNPPRVVQAAVPSQAGTAVSIAVSPEGTFPPCPHGAGPRLHLPRVGCEPPPVPGRPTPGAGASGGDFPPLRRRSLACREFARSRIRCTRGRVVCRSDGHHGGEWSSPKKCGWPPAALPSLCRFRRSAPARGSSAGAPCHRPGRTDELGDGAACNENPRRPGKNSRAGRSDPPA
jgi:hypothetical protein